MNEVANLIQGCSEKSLAVIDELGRGTSTDFGIGIAKAVALELVKNVRCFTLFATHFHELPDLAEETDGVSNVFVKFEKRIDRVEMLYKLEEGRAMQSCGINVLTMLGFPNKIIDHARGVLAQFEGGMSQ